MIRILFCNISYLPYYNTRLDRVAPKNGGAYVAKMHDAYEKHNFEECADGQYRGFVETKYRIGYEEGIATNTYNSLHIERIDPFAKGKTYLDDVLVVFCAKPENSQTVIVGWYKNATVFRRRPFYNGRFFNIQADRKDGFLLPEDQRKIFYNTHPAIIKQEVFDKVQEIRQQRHRRTATGKSSPFSGLVFCADCRQKLYYSTTNYFEKRQDFFICSTHRANKDKCSGHYIRAVVLEDVVWKHMKEVISFVSQYEAHFRVEMEQKLRLQSEETIKVYKKRLAQAEKRIGELDRLFIKIYEDNAKGNLSDERFAMMSKTYEDEQAQLKVEIVNLQKEVEVQERQIENLEQFIQRVRRYTTLTELTPYALRELVKAVYVEAPDKSSGKRKQKVHIEYDLVGYIPVDELIKAEQA